MDVKYEVIKSFELVSRDTSLYGRSSNRDDRVGHLIKVSLPSGEKYIIYDESFFRFPCTANEYGINFVFIDGYEIEIESYTTDFRYKKYDSYEDAIIDLEAIEDYGYYTVVFS